MKQFRYVAIVVTAMVFGVTLVNLASAAWTAYSAPSSSTYHEFNNSHGDFEMSISDYYDNNDSDSVDLNYATIRLRYPSDCCLQVSRVDVYDGVATGHSYNFEKVVDVDVNEWKIYNLPLYDDVEGDPTYTKEPGGNVTVDNRAGFFDSGSCFDCSTTYVWWDTNTSINHGYQN